MMTSHTGKRLALGLVLACTAGLAASGYSPVVHAAATAPTLSASITAYGSSDQISVTGSGFTPGGTINVNVVDAGTGTVLSTTSWQASTGTATVTYASESVLVCNPNGATGYPTPKWNPLTGTWQYFPPGYTGQIAPVPYTAEPGSVNGYGYGYGYGQACQYQTVNIPQTAYTGGGELSTNFSVAVPSTTASVLVEASDMSTGVTSNQVAISTVNGSVPSLTANIMDYGANYNQFALLGTGFAYNSQEPLTIEVINTATGAILATIPVTQSSFESNGQLYLTFTLPSLYGSQQLALTTEQL